MKKRTSRGLRSRRTPDGMEEIQLSSALTFAEEALRTVVANGLKHDVVRWERRSIIVPPQKAFGRVKPLKVQLAETVLNYRGGALSDNTYEKGCAIIEQDHLYASYEEEMDIRHIFFTGIVIVKGKGGGHEWRHIRAIVRIWKLHEPLWDEADVKVWSRDSHGSDPHKGSFKYSDGLKVSNGSDAVHNTPPAFLAFD